MVLILIGFNSFKLVLIPVPHLFLTFISDLLWAIKYSKVHHFADDANLNFSSSIKLINKQVNYDLKVNSLAL